MPNFVKLGAPKTLIPPQTQKKRPAQTNGQGVATKQTKTTKPPKDAVHYAPHYEERNAFHSPLEKRQ